MTRVHHLLWPALLGIACGQGSGTGSLPGDSPGKPDGGHDGDVDGGVVDVVDAMPPTDPPLAPVVFHIDFDYRYDATGFFDDPSRRATLEEAANAWGRIFIDDYPAIPAGTTVRTRDPRFPYDGGESFAIDDEIDDLLIFVGCAELDGPGGTTAIANHTAAIEAVADDALREELRDRYRGEIFQPWTGWIGFDCEESWYFDDDITSDADIPASDSDFWSVAMHEIGHVLGFGTADIFFELRTDEPYYFTGQRAVSLYGEAVPLTTSGHHLGSDVRSDGEETLLDPSRPGGVRTPPTALDIAVLADLGHTPAP